jgi:hypothetical protein
LLLLSNNISSVAFCSESTIESRPMWREAASNCHGMVIAKVAAGSDWYPGDAT